MIGCVMQKILLKENERIEEVQFAGIRLIQNPQWFCYGIDAVLLSKFCKAKNGWRAVDLGTGTGIIPLLLCRASNFNEIIGIEIQDEVADMAYRSVKLNNLEHKVKILNTDLNNACDYIEMNSFDMVISNPPYMSKNEGLKNKESIKACSRHEMKASLEEVIAVAYKLLKPQGHFYMVHRPHRLADIFCTCREYRLEPKKIQFVHPKMGKRPNILLLHCTKYGKKELKFMDPLYVYNEDGTYTEEILEIYGK